MIQDAISKLVLRQNLTLYETENVMNQIMEGRATNAQIAAFLVSLRLKGETIDEITACAKIMRRKSTTINPKVKYLVDTCGTGGDGTGTFNISTAAAFVVAGCGVSVAKHGNKSVSSKCGSADVLSALGINIEVSPERVEKCIEEVGMGFMFAPMFHPAMKHALTARKEIGIRTVFNMLGPLTNPANAQSQLIGVFNSELLIVFAEVLKNLNVKHALIVHGNGLDEITVCGKTQVCELKNGIISQYEINPSDFGFEISSMKELKGGSAEENAEIILEILNGSEGPKRDIVLINSAAALLTTGIVNNLKDGIKMSEESIDSGKALQVLENLIKFTNQNAKQNN